ncbi:hypothetical protein CFB84_37665 [Burkholderia aenigmatica]|uniref:Uncharacterized protein n=1 Tax=Burkholderia aenigmatica TaxID=2015348 RepID=A0A228HYZ4_9BURK|nr:hypothetical protein CFB84_37665 [Burkholderia aenigmatica]
MYPDSHNLNFPNRPVRTRMPGGVAGERPHGRPLCRLLSTIQGLDTGGVGENDCTNATGASHSHGQSVACILLGNCWFAGNKYNRISCRDCHGQY